MFFLCFSSSSITFVVLFALFFIHAFILICAIFLLAFIFYDSIQIFWSSCTEVMQHACTGQK